MRKSATSVPRDPDALRAAIVDLGARFCGSLPTREARTISDPQRRYKFALLCDGSSRSFPRLDRRRGQECRLPDFLLPPVFPTRVPNYSGSSFCSHTDLVRVGCWENYPGSTRQCPTVIIMQTGAGLQSDLLGVMRPRAAYPVWHAERCDGGWASI